MEIKMFWRVKASEKGQASNWDEMVNDQILQYGVEVRRR